MQYYSNWNRNNREPQWKKTLKSAGTGIAGFFASVKNRFFRNMTWKKAAKYALYLAAFVLISGSIVFFMVSLSLPNPNKLSTRDIAQSTKIYARDGETVLYEIHGEAKRTLVELKDIPDSVRNATIAIEDRNFYTNNGIDITGILRSVFKNLTSGDLTGQGGSTITQQFAKNAILLDTRESTLETYMRKVKEIVLAIQIEQKFSKDEILQMYLNEIPYGRNAYGIQAAAQTYFGKNASNLTLAESAWLAAVPQLPSYYNNNPDRWELRKNRVLEEMHSQGYITQEEMTAAQAEEVEFSKIKTGIKAPHFVLYVQELLAEQYGEKTLEEGGLEVVTTLDWDLQQMAEKAVADNVARNQATYGAENASLVAIDPKTGQILAMVGSKDYFSEEFDGQVNVAIRERQPGSSFKPYVYAAGFKEGMSPATLLMDVRTVFGTFGGKEYAPNNYNGTFIGPVSARSALAGSLNVPAVKMLALTGVQDAINLAKDLGISSPLDTDRCGLSLVLGGCEVTLLDHTSAMGVFANMGVRHDHTPILSITDADEEVLAEYKEAGQEALDPQIAYEIVDIMSDNNARAYVFGANNRLTLPGRPVAAKTGTTQEWKDGWTVGYTPSLVAGVWVGNNSGELMRAGADGSLVAAPIWNQFMREATAGTPVENFQQPEGIQRLFVDSVSGKLPTSATPSTKQEVFAQNSVPTEEDDVHVVVRVNRMNNKLATDQTPESLVEERTYTILHSEMPDNANWENPVRAWAEAAGYTYPPTEYDDGEWDEDDLDGETRVSFAQPTNNDRVSQKFEARLSVFGASPERVELFLEGDKVGERTSGPWTFTVNAEETGWQTLMATVHMEDDQRLNYSIRVEVSDAAAEFTTDPGGGFFPVIEL